MKKKSNIILPKDIIKPDYDGGSIVNLMSSIMKASGGKPEYPELKILKSDELKKYKNILFILLDGLGYEYLMKYGKDSFMMKNLRGKITSVFPATTTAAITSLATGVAPQQHAMTGWYMNAKELGMTTIPLKFVPKIGGKPLSASNIDPKFFYNMEFFDQKIRRKTYVVQRIEIVTSDYNSKAYSRSKILAYMNLKGFFEGIRLACGQKGEKYIFAYWPTIDTLLHLHGTKHRKVCEHFRQLDKYLERTAKKLKDTIMIITADHGLIDTGKTNTILLRNHPKLAEMLSMPLAADTRTSYCYVCADMTAYFEKYVKKNFRDKCVMLTRKQAISSGLFGKGESHPKFMDRIGDYVLIWRGHNALKDALLGQEYTIHKGSHGGASSTEMYVPLVVVKR